MSKIIAKNKSIARNLKAFETLVEMRCLIKIWKSTTRETKDLAENEYDQSDLISVDGMFGVESRPDPMAEYMALAENLQQECDQVFQNLEE